MKNPFILTIAKEENFGDRIEERNQFINLLNEDRSIWLAAPRRTGKTSLVREVLNQIESKKEAVFIYIDLFRFSSTEEMFDELIKTCLKQFYEKASLFKKSKKKILDIIKTIVPTFSVDPSTGSFNFSISPSFNDIPDKIEYFFSSLNNLTNYFQKKVIIAFDEFQQIEIVSRNLTSLFSVKLQQYSNINYVFLGSDKHMMDLIMTRSEFSFAIPVYLNDINNSEFESFFYSKFTNTGVDISLSVIKTVLNITNPSLYYTQLFFIEIWDSKKNSKSEKDYTVLLSSILLILKRHNSIFRTYIDLLSESEVDILKQLSKSDSNNSFTKADLKCLYTKEIIYNNLYDQIEICDLLFKLWLIHKYDNIERYLTKNIVHLADSANNKDDSNK